MKKLLSLYWRSYLSYFFIILAMPWLALAVDVLFNFGKFKEAELLDTPFMVSIFGIICSPILSASWASTNLGLNLSWLRQLPVSRSVLVKFNLLIGFFTLLASVLSFVFVAYADINFHTQDRTLIGDSSYLYWSDIFLGGIIIPPLLSVWAFAFSLSASKKNSFDIKGHNPYWIHGFFVFLVLVFFFSFKALLSGHQLLGMMWFLIIPIVLAWFFAKSLALDIQSRRYLIKAVAAAAVFPTFICLFAVWSKLPQMSNKALSDVLHYEIKLLGSRLSKDQYRDFLRSEYSGGMFPLYKAHYEERFNKLDDDDFVSFLQSKDFPDEMRYLSAWNKKSLGSYAFRSYIVWADEGGEKRSNKNVHNAFLDNRNTQDIEWLLLAKSPNLRHTGLLWSRYIQSERILELLKNGQRYLDLELPYKKTLAILGPLMSQNRSVASRESDLCQNKTEERYPGFCLRKWVKELGLTEKYYGEIEDVNEEWPLNASSLTKTQRDLFLQIKEKKFPLNKSTI